MFKINLEMMGSFWCDISHLLPLLELFCCISGQKKSRRLLFSTFQEIEEGSKHVRSRQEVCKRKGGSKPGAGKNQGGNSLETTLTLRVKEKEGGELFIFWKFFGTFQNLKSN